MIKAGDLVQIVRPMRCGCNGSLGRLFVVQEVLTSPSRGRHYVHDGGCGRETYPAGTKVARWPGDYLLTTEISRLKRIPPLDELEGEKRDTDLKEPA